VTEEPIVEAYAGAFYPERPVSFTRGGRRVTVAELTRQWRTPDEIHFDVVTDDGSRFEMVYKFSQDRWQVIAR